MRQIIEKWFIMSPFFVILCLPAFAGENIKSDSLIQVLQQRIPPAQKMAVYEQLLAIEIFRDPVSSLDYAEKMLDLSRELNEKDYEAVALSSLGILYDMKGEYSLALQYHFKTLDLFEELQYEQAKATSYNNISVLYQVLNKNEKAYNYQLKALETCKNVKDSIGEMTSYNNLGIILNEQGKHQEARSFYWKALEINQYLKDPTIGPEVFKNMGRAYADEQRPDSALYFYHKSRKAIPQTKDKLMEAELHQYFACVYVDTKEYAKSIKHGLISYELAKAHEFERELMMANQILANAYEQSGQYDKGLEHHRQYAELKESLFSKEKENALMEVELRYKNEQNEKMIALLDKEREVKEAKLRFHRLVNLCLMGGSFLLLFLVVMGSMANRHKKKINRTLSLQQMQIEEKNIALRQANAQLTEHQQILSTTNQELKEKNQSLSELNAEKNNLISIVAHDLRSPLNEIYGLSQLIELSGSDNLNDEQQHYTQLIKQSSNRLNRMIANILDIEAIENTGIKVNPEAVDLRSLIEEVVANKATAIHDKEIKMSVWGSIENEVYVDKNYAFQVFENLLSNAIKFSPPGRKVNMQLESHEQSALVGIHDEGPGISEEDQKKLFQKFQKLTARPIGEGSSTGLGLSIVKKYVEAMDGRVWCESKQGKGATFWVEFPLMQKENSGKSMKRGEFV